MEPGAGLRHPGGESGLVGMLHEGEGPSRATPRFQGGEMWGGRICHETMGLEGRPLYRPYWSG